MKWQNVRRRRGKKKRGRKVEKLKYDTILGLVERKSFTALGAAIQRAGICDDWLPTENEYGDPLPMAVFRWYMMEGYKKESDSTLIDDVEFFFKALLMCPEYKVNEINKDGDTLLHLICKTDNVQPLLDLLLEREDIDINIKDKFDCTPLDICTLYGNTPTIQKIKDAGGLSSEEVTEIVKKKTEEVKPFASLEEYREMKVNNFYPKTANIKKLLDPNVLDKKWI